jgi:hypothetical protein
MLADALRSGTSRVPVSGPEEEFDKVPDEVRDKYGVGFVGLSEVVPPATGAAMSMSEEGGFSSAGAGATMLADALRSGTSRAPVSGPEEEFDEVSLSQGWSSSCVGV